MKNRIASLFLVFALLMSLCNFAVARDNRITVQSGGAERFTDVPTDHWAYGYINQVVGSGLFNGKTPTTFEPSNAMTRSQFVMVMARMEGMSSLEGQYTVTKFPDVTPTRRAAGPIAWASADEQGFVRGFGDGTFKPDSPITRGQFAALIHRYIIAKRYTNLHVVDPIPAQFTDVESVSSAFTEDVEYARVHGLLTGYSDGTVRASNPITRAAIAAILARFLDLVTESGYTPLLDGPEGAPVQSGDEPTVNVPTSYDGMRLNITNKNRGTTTFLSVLRNGVQVASDDLKPGDVVTLSHVPNDGYRATITVKDSKGRKVDVTTNGNVSTFTVPENMPVTITLKYLKEGSSNGGGGGGSSGGGGGIAPPPAYGGYYLHANAVRSPASTADGSVWLSKEPPTAANIATLTANESLSLNWDDVSNHGNVFVFYAILQASANVTANCIVSVGGTVQPNAITATDTTSVPGYTLLTISATSTGTTAATATAATLTVTFTRGQSTDSGDPGPGPGTERHWTVSVTNNEFVYSALSTTDPTAPTAENPNTPTVPAALTANGSASVEQTVTDGTAANVYLTLTPRAGFKFDANALELTPAEGTTVTQVYPAAANSTATDQVRVYRITRSAFPTANTTTNVSILMQLLSGVGRTHNVTVNSRLADGTVLPTAEVPLEATADLNRATYLNRVTVTVPFLTGYRGYSLSSITVVGADNTTVTYTKDNANSSATGDVYYFTMPDKDVTVTVTYTANANANLNFDVPVSITGQGTVSLNIAGVNKTTDANTTYHVKLDNDGAVIVTEGNDTNGTLMTQADYVELYGNENFTLPVYLTAAPVAGQNHRFTSASYDGTAVSADNISAEQTVRNGIALNVSVSFSPITSYGYNLTVIGQGTVSVDGDDSASVFHTSAPYRNASDAPETYSSGLIVDAPSTLNISATPTVASGKSASDYEVTINGEDTTNGSATIDLTRDALTDIVVEMQPKDRDAVRFTVQVTGGSVRVKPESGRIMNASGYTAETAKDQLKTTSGTLTSDTVNSTTRAYFAFENSVITIIPNTDDTSKVKQITVRKADGSVLSDVMSTEGFSFQLKTATTADIRFGTFDSYSVQLQAPYGGTPSMRSLSTNIAKTGDPTVQEILYSLNDGQRSDSATNTRTGITNVFSFPATLNQALVYYFNNRVVKDEDGNQITGADNVKNMLEESITSSIATVFPSVVEAKKADLKANPSNVTGPISTEMRNRQAANPTLTEVTGAAKSTVLETVFAGTDMLTQLQNGEVQESSFQVMANVTTILSAEKENQLKTQYPALANVLNGKSAESQLSNFVSDYLGKIKVQDGYNYSNLTPVFTVEASNSVPPTLTISARVTAANNNWPQLDSSISMTQYADRFNVWILAVISSVIQDSNGNGVFEATEAISLPAMQPSLYSAAQLDISVDKASMLSSIDSAVRNTWNSNFSSSGIDIDMTQVLSGKMIGDVVKDAIEAPSNTLTSKVNSLGNGTNTRAAFMNLYDGFVECDPKTPNSMLTLKTKGGTSTVIGRATNNNQSLVLTLNFNEILRDEATPTDQTSYEALADLLVGLRNGISTDIRENSNAGKSAQSVIASLIEGQLNGRNRNAVTVNKWGVTKQGSQLTAAEKKEVSNLIAGMVMNSKMEDSFDTVVWRNFEKSGYQSVTFILTLDAARRASLAPILESVADVLGSDPTRLEVGLNVTQDIND